MRVSELIMIPHNSESNAINKVRCSVINELWCLQCGGLTTLTVLSHSQKLTIDFLQQLLEFPILGETSSHTGGQVVSIQEINQYV